MNGLDIAIVGLSCRFAHCDNPNEYWRNILNGKDLITYRNNNGADASNMWVPARGIIDGLRAFDTKFFGFSEAEGALCDPQLRLLLEVSWEALEDAGYGFQNQELSTGVFASTSSSYTWRTCIDNDTKMSTANGKNLAYITDEHYYSTQISYRFDLTGPSFIVSSACSSSLVAMHEACRSLIMGECSAALVCSASVGPYHCWGYPLDGESIYSIDGKCRPFDSRANGTVPGDGAGAILLKNLDQAMEDNDHIYAVIAGSAVNNDGHNKISYAAPGTYGIASAMLSALVQAGIEPEDLSFVEMHGSGTALGDAIECEALQEVFGNRLQNPCLIGSVKPNIGYLDTACGIASLIKAALSLSYGVYPPTINFESFNPMINQDKSNLYVNREATTLDGSKPLYAGVNSYGDGGTNSHIILTQAPRNKEAPKTAESYYLVTFSAASQASLYGYLTSLGTFFEAHRDLPIDGIANTLNTGRKSFAYRGYAVCKSTSDLRKQLVNGLVKLNDEHTARTITQIESRGVADKSILDIPHGDKNPQALHMLGNVWLNGYDIPWRDLYTYTSAKIPMPTYCFDRKDLREFIRYFAEASYE